MKKELVISKLNESLLYGIAHRGYHDENATENGLKAFKNALDKGIAIELDVHLTKDGILAVCHDSELERTTGKKGIIEDLTFLEIRENYRLKDGGEVPSLKEVLTLIDEKVPLVIELKVYNRNYKPLVKRLKEELKDVRDKKNYMLISFDPRALFPLKRSGFIRSLLVSSQRKDTYFFRRFFESVDLDQTLFADEKIQKYHEKHLVNCWTIESEEQLQKVLPYIDTATFQHMDHEVVKAKLKK